jgi:hypothetical protein
MNNKLDYIPLRILITVLYFVGALGAVYAIIEHQAGWNILGFAGLYFLGAGLRAWMIANNHI